MNALIQAIQNIDVSVFQLLNSFAGNPTVDGVAAYIEGSRLLKGGVFMALCWSCWFSPGKAQEARRALVATVVGALLAIVVSRLIADLGGMRLRPVYVPQLHFHPYAAPLKPDLVDWSSFPSDHAAFFFALAFGLAHVWNRARVPLMLWVLVSICLPRLFLGLHWASDVAAGAAVGIALAWTMLKIDSRWPRPATLVVVFADAAPQVFYGAGFLVSFEMGVLFDDVRKIAIKALLLLHHGA